MPSQVSGRMKVRPLQEPGLHTVPAGYLRQLPAPSHLPSVPQPEAGCSGQVLVGSTTPAPTAWQTPRNPGTLHARQLPHGPLSQQTPSVQWPVSHWASPAHAAPWDLRRQVLPAQVLGAAQSPSTVQVVLQLPPEQA